MTRGRRHRRSAARTAPARPGRRLVIPALVLALSGALPSSPAPRATAAAGAADTRFGTGGTVVTAMTGGAAALGVAVQADGRIVAAGSAEVDEDTDFALARYETDGSLDTGFNASGMTTTAFNDDGADNAHAHAVAVQPDGRIVAAGGAGSPRLDFALARYRPDGSLDETLNAGGRVTTAVSPAQDDVIHALAVQPDGKLVAAGGAYRSPPTNADFALARYRLDGSLDAGFGNGGTAVTVTGSGAGAAAGQEPFAHAVALQPDGRIVAGGSAIVDGNLDFAVVRYTPSGTPDPTFGGGDGVVTTPVGVEEDEIRAVVVQDDGRIVVAGWSATGGSTDVALARYTADGVPDPTFGPSGNGTVVTALSPDEDRASGMIADAGGNVVVAGWAVVEDRARIALARYGAGGGLDISFGNDGIVTTPVAGVDAGATSIARRGDGGIVVAGAAGSIPSSAVLLPTFTGFALASYLGDPVMGVSDATVTEGDGGQVSASFRVLLSSPAGPHGARATYATADDTAVASADYAPTSGVVEVAPGATEATVAVAVRGDRGDEAAERFLLRLSEPSGAVLGRSEGVATIVDDEELVIDTVAGAPLLFERVVVRPSVVDDDAVLVRVCSDPRRSPCVDLSGLAPGAHPNPLLVEGASFSAGQPDPEPATTVRSIPGGTGLDTTAGLEIHLASPAPAVELTFAHAGTPPRVVAVSTDGSTSPIVDVPGPAGQPNAVRLPAPGGAAVAQQPFAVAAADRYVYVADPVNHLVRFLDPRASDGCPCESVFAGNGARGAAAPGADPLATELAGPYAIAPRRTAPGVVAEMYVADTFGHRVLRIAPPAPPAPTGAPPTVAVVAGTGALGFSGDGGPGPAAQLNSPYGVAHDDARGITYVADTLNHRIRAVRTDGTIATIAGDGAAGYSGDGGPAAAARLNSPRGLVVDGAGNLYVADTSNNAVRRIDPSGTILTLAGTGVAGFSGDGGLAFRARLDQPAAVAVDDESPPNVFVADTMNHRIRRVDGDTGRVSTLAGTGDEGFSGDNGDALAADLNAPFGVAVRPDGDVVVADTGNARVRVVGAAGPGGIRPIRTLAGNGTPSHPPASVTPATAGPLAGASAVATWVRPSANPSDDPRPRLVTFVADPFDHSVKMIDRNGRLRVIAGNGRPGYSGDGGPAGQARLFSPFGLALDRSSPPKALFVADTLNNVVRRIELNLNAEAAGTITTVAGDGTAGYAGDGGPATAARLSYPTGVSLDVAGSLYVADAYNARVRRVDPGGTVTTFAGTGRLGSSGDGGPASDADLFFPYGVAADDATPANVYVADSFNHRVRRIEGTSGTVTTVAGTGIPGDGPERVATAAALNRPWGVAVGAGPAGDVFIADSLNHRVRRVDAASGLLSTLAANGQPGRQGDLGPAVRARVSEPRGVAPVEASGVDDVVMVADSFSNRVRQVGLTVARVFSEPVRFTVEAFDVGCGADCPVRAVSVTNRGHNTLTVDQVAVAGPAAGDYRVARDGCSDRKVPPGSGCVVQVTFAPTASCPGPAPCRNAVLRVGGNGADSVREVRLLGAVDVPTCFGRQATFVGTRGDDVIVGTEGPDVIHGGPGNDRITGLGGDDVICGGEGDDGADALGEALDGGPGNDIVLGGPGNDAIMGNAGDDVLMGDDGDDYLDGGVGGCCDLATNTGNDILFGGAGDDRLFAADFGSAYMAGEAGDDALNGYGGADTLVGGSGNDTELSAGGGEDLVDVRDGVGDNDGGNAGPGDDTCRTDDGPEVILECLDDPPDPVG